MLKVAVVRFPGSNCDEDALRAAELVGLDAFYVWHRETSLRGADVASGVPLTSGITPRPASSAPGTPAPRRRPSARARC